jgi:hypothetical protein
MSDWFFAIIPLCLIGVASIFAAVGFIAPAALAQGLIDCFPDFVNEHGLLGCALFSTGILSAIGCGVCTGIVGYRMTIKGN